MSHLPPKIPATTATGHATIVSFRPPTYRQIAQISVVAISPTVSPIGSFLMMHTSYHACGVCQGEFSSKYDLTHEELRCTIDSQRHQAMLVREPPRLRHDRV